MTNPDKIYDTRVYRALRRVISSAALAQDRRCRSRG